MEKDKKDDIRAGYPDCCFSVNDNWFRLRTVAIIIEDNSLLLVKNAKSPNYYSVGGGVHMNEKAEDCVIREVREETGVDYQVDHLAVICENFFKEAALDYDPLHCHVIEFYYLMKSRGKKDAKCNTYGWNNEKEEISWIPLDQLAQTNVKPEFLRHRIKEILEGKSLIHIVNDER